MTDPAIAEAEATPLEALAGSSALLRERELPRQRWDRDGVRFFRGAVSAPAIDRAGAEYLARLKEMAVVTPEAAGPRWNGRDRLDGTLARPIGDDVWRALVADGKLDRLVRTFVRSATDSKMK